MDQDETRYLAVDSGNTPSGVSSVPTLAPGTRLANRYRILERIGRGGMGEVYRAEHLDLKTVIAIKVMRFERDSDMERLRRFEREARAILALDHPNIVRVMDFGKAPLPFLAMEYIAGISLAQYLDQSSSFLPLEVVVGLMEQMLGALQAAHDRGIVHRDLKPENVLLTQLEGVVPHVKVVDFGLARFDDVLDAGPTLTNASLIAGSPAYMSPEQCRSMTVGPESDIYAMGCILTELLQLTPPFEADSGAVLMSLQMFTPPGPLERSEDAEPIPAELEALRLQMLAKHAHQRPPSARVIAERLRSILDDERGDEASGRRSPSERGSFRPSSNPALMPQVIPLRVGSVGPSAGGLSGDCLAGLGVHGIECVTLADHQLASAESDIVILGAVERDIDTLKQQARLLAASGKQVIACVQDTSAFELQALLESGVTDLVSAPPEASEVVDAIRRATRRRTEDSRREE